ncbi:MAG: hypothetical protein RL297_151 [Pseudomonadota bacterium]|jgi:hypothetical protein
MSLFLLLPPIAMTILAWLCYRQHFVARTFTVAVVFGVGFWYAMPGAAFLLVPGIQGEDSYLLSSDGSALHSIILINFSLALLLLLPGVVLHGSRIRHRTLQRELLSFSEASLEKLLLLTIVSAGSLLLMRFEELGPAFALKLLIGLTSARDVMSFENTSSGLKQSLIGLWELLTVFISVFIATTYVWLRRTMSWRFVLASLSTVLLYASSGTRSVILLLIFSLITALISRPAVPLLASRQISKRRKRKPLLPLVLIFGLCVTAVMSTTARFANDSSQADNVFINTLLVHNDMFRELLFSITKGNGYRSDGWLLLQVPITFAMPSFLGFTKTIPPHLVDFNLDRAGIYLIGGSGNVFPGLIADMYLCFGNFGPLVQAALSGIFLLLLWQATLKVNKSAIGGALFVTLLAYYVVSFRNMQGSIGILLVVTFLLSRLMYARVTYRGESGKS